jgi:hypothetical protein
MRGQPACFRVLFGEKPGNMQAVPSLSYFAAQVKLAASSVLPDPLYRATWG